MPDIVFQVGDLVTRDGTDVQRVVKADDGHGCIEVECIKEPLGYLNADGTRELPWCRVGMRESNLSRRYDYAGEVIDGQAVETYALSPPQDSKS